MNDQTTYEIIERFLSSELEGEELREFEARLANEEGLREEVELHRGLKDAIGDTTTMDFLQAVQNAENNYFGSDSSSEDDAPPANAPKPVLSIWRQSYSFAAVILLLVVVGGVFFIQQLNQNSPADLYKEYFSPYEAPGEWRSSDPVLNAELQSAFESYNAQNFEAALTTFQFIEKQDSSNVTARFYLSICALSVGKVSMAISRLESLSSLSGHPYRSQSRWYLALAYLQQEQIEPARKLLETLSQGSGKYPGLARDLLPKL